MPDSLTESATIPDLRERIAALEQQLAAEVARREKADAVLAEFVGKW